MTRPEHLQIFKTFYHYNVNLWYPNDYIVPLKSLSEPAVADFSDTLNQYWQIFIHMSPGDSASSDTKVHGTLEKMSKIHPFSIFLVMIYWILHPILETPMLLRHHMKLKELSRDRKYEWLVLTYSFELTTLQGMNKIYSVRWMKNASKLQQMQNILKWKEDEEKHKFVQRL